MAVYTKQLLFSFGIIFFFWAGLMPFLSIDFISLIVLVLAAFKFGDLAMFISKKVFPDET
jgi:hypothetical protein